MPSWHESDLRPPGRLVNTPKDKTSETRHFITKKMLFFYVRSRNVYENKGNYDKLPE
jgi:hypothetical protein